jgi:hypothetical protein
MAQEATLTKHQIITKTSAKLSFECPSNLITEQSEWFHGTNNSLNVIEQLGHLRSLSRGFLISTTKDRMAAY